MVIKVISLEGIPMRLHNRSGQMAMYEFLIILFFVGCTIGEGFIIWHLLKSQNADNSFYASGSQPTVTHNEPNIHPLCGIIFDINGRNNAKSTSSQTNGT